MKVILLLFTFLYPVSDWPQFRGPDGQGHSDEQGLPLNWSETTNVRWKIAIPGKGWSSPVIQNERIWLTGIATCLDAKTGQVYWRARLGGNHSASPIYADGRIYFLTEEGESVVIAPGQQLKHLGTNQIDGRTLASIAVAKGSIFIRSETHLYRIGK